MLTKEDLIVTLQLIDLAIKAGGLSVAEQALPIAVKIRQELTERNVDVQSEEA